MLLEWCEVSPVWLSVIVISMCDGNIVMSMVASMVRAMRSILRSILIQVAPQPSIYEAYSAKNRHIDAVVILLVIVAVVIVAECFRMVYLYKPVVPAMVHCKHFGVK